MFHCCSVFENYQGIETLEVGVAFGSSSLFGNGIVTLAIYKRLKVEFVHGPQSKSNIVSFRLLPKKLG